MGLVTEVARTRLGWLDRDLALLIAGGILVRLACLGVGTIVTGAVVDTVFAWDAGHYFQIAQHGYPPGQPLPTAADWAFYPVWPSVLAVLIRLPPAPWIPVVAAGVTLTAVNMALITLVLEPWVGRREARLVALCWAAAPPAWIYLTAYSEGLYVALELALILAIVRRRTTLVASLAFAIGLCRLQGAIWALAAAWWIVFRDTGQPGRPRPLGRRLLIAAFALSGGALWQLVVSAVTGIVGGWFALEALPGWATGLGVRPWLVAFDAVTGLLGGVFDRRLAVAVMIVAIVLAVAGLLRRREEIVGRWPTALVVLQKLFVSGR